MNDPQLESLPSDLQSLLAGERNAYPEDGALKEAVLVHVEMVAVLAGTHGPGGSETAAATGHAGAGAASTLKGAALGKLIAVGLASFVAGGAVGAGVTQNRAPVAANPARLPTAPLAQAVSPPTDVETTIAVSALPLAPSSPAPPRASAPSRGSANAAGDLTRERELLDVARAALARGRPEDALAAGERHARQWPHGDLVEEREVVMIQALVAAGRKSDAALRAAQFRATFPKSVLLPVVNTASP